LLQWCSRSLFQTFLNEVESVLSHEEHRRAAKGPIGVALITVSDTRTPETDTSGPLARTLLEDAGHRVADYRIVKDEPDDVRGALAELASRGGLRAVILTGGTGISRRDRTFEAVVSVLDRRLDGFGELFRALSYQEIGSAAMLSRSVAGILGDKVVFALPGSTAAVRLSLEKLILPELDHLVAELDKST
jgi:molybdenum cofactor biosynthesis protein B